MRRIRLALAALFTRRRPLQHPSSAAPQAKDARECALPVSVSPAFLKKEAGAAAAALRAYEEPPPHLASGCDSVTPASATCGAIENETETPEAALTMNLINKKRQTKKETMLQVVHRVRRREKSVQIAQALHVGIGEVELALRLAKLKT